MKIKASIRTHMVGSKVEDELEIPDEEWDSMTQEEQEKMVYDYMCQYLDFWYEEEKNELA